MASVYCPVQYRTAAGPVTSKEPLCVQRAEKAQSSSAFSSLPLGQNKYFISCGGNPGRSIKILQLLTGSVTHTPSWCVCTQRGRAECSAELTAVLTGDNNSRSTEDQEQKN